mmetsp:Transcript_50017/g.140201  ORF Transcript_50017/g.140201 Transcript_50017/m.140201 type:complete len:208 (+) Transcript_50017:418-1041(+)
MFQDVCGRGGLRVRNDGFGVLRHLDRIEADGACQRCPYVFALLTVDKLVVSSHQTIEILDHPESEDRVVFETRVKHGEVRLREEVNEHRPVHRQQGRLRVGLIKIGERIRDSLDRVLDPLRGGRRHRLACQSEGRHDAMDSMCFERQRIAARGDKQGASGSATRGRRALGPPNGKSRVSRHAVSETPLRPNWQPESAKKTIRTHRFP